MKIPTKTNKHNKQTILKRDTKQRHTKANIMEHINKKQTKSTQTNLKPQHVKQQHTQTRQ